MNGSVFDRLQKALDVQKEAEGISPGDIAALPAPLRRIMRLMLREVELTYADLWSAVEAAPEADRMTRPDLDAALKTLATQGWLICRGEGERLNYTVNLRRKAGSKLGTNFWTSLDARIEESKKNRA